MHCELGDLCHRKNHDEHCYRRTVVYHLRKQSDLLTEVLDQLVLLNEQESEEVATQQEFTDAIAAARSDLANIAADEAKQTAEIQRLNDLIAAGGMTAAEEATALADVAALEAELKAAADAVPDA